MNLYKEDWAARTYYIRQITVFLYVEAIKFLMKFLAAASNKTKTTREITASRKTPIEISLQFVGKHFTKIVSWRNIYPEECTERVSIDDQLANVWKAVKIICGFKQIMDFSGITQYVKTLLE